MFKIAILGCENSHANQFLDFVLRDKLFDDVEVVGVYSNEPEAMERIKAQYGVYTASSYDEFAGKVDGIVITARHGDNHYKYAKPYIESGIPMFIDKPITISEQEAVEFMRDIKAHGNKITGGSCCIYSPEINELRRVKEDERYGKVLGGFLKAPNISTSPYGGFFFYSQHIVQMMTRVFGNYPYSVSSFKNGGVITSVVRYDDYDVTAVLTDSSFKYYASIICEKKVKGEMYDGGPENFYKEFDKFVGLMRGTEEGEDLRDFISPVFIMNAMVRSMENNGKEEKINAIPGI